MQRFDLRTAVVIGLVLVAVIFLFRQKNSPDKSQIENRSVTSSEKPSKKIENSENRVLRDPQSTAMKSLRVAEFRTLEDLHKEFGSGWASSQKKMVMRKRVKMVYKASLTQTSGIDWKNTKLTLSTGTPNFGVVAPVLTPWYLQLYVPGIYTDLQRRAAAGNAQRNLIQSYRDDEKLAEEVVVTALGVERKPKNLAYSTTTIDPSTLQQYTTLNEGQLNTNFEIDLPYDIESDGQLHSVTIKDQEIACTLKNYAVPRIDKDAYLLAEVADWQNLDLLPGDANIIMDDTYIGKSVIDPRIQQPIH